MLVCAFFAQFCTRDRGCSAHPAFPAPSMLEGRTFMQTSGKPCREKAELCLESEEAVARMSEAKSGTALTMIPRMSLRSSGLRARWIAGQWRGHIDSAPDSYKT